MKKVLSILCALAVVLGVAVLPTGVNATSATELTPTWLHRVTESESGGEKVYTADSWTAGSITFDYKIESGYVYYLSFDYMGGATADTVPMASTVSSTGQESHINDTVEKAVSLNVPASTSTFINVWCELSGDALLESGGEYLAINWKHVDPAANFKNFTIQSIANGTDGYIHPVKLLKRVRFPKSLKTAKLFMN